MKTTAATSLYVVLWTILLYFVMVFAESEISKVTCLVGMAIISALDRVEKAIKEKL